MEIFKSTDLNHDEFWVAWSRNSFIVNSGSEHLISSYEERGFWFGSQPQVNPWNLNFGHYCKISDAEFLCLIPSIEENLYFINQWLESPADRYENLLDTV